MVEKLSWPRRPALMESGGQCSKTNKNITCNSFGTFAQEPNVKPLLGLHKLCIFFQSAFPVTNPHKSKVTPTYPSQTCLRWRFPSTKAGGGGGATTMWWWKHTGLSFSSFDCYHFFIYSDASTVWWWKQNGVFWAWLWFRPSRWIFSRLVVESLVIESLRCNKISSLIVKGVLRADQTNI